MQEREGLPGGGAGEVSHDDDDGGGRGLGAVQERDCDPIQYQIQKRKRFGSDRISARTEVSPINDKFQNIILISTIFVSFRGLKN